MFGHQADQYTSVSVRPSVDRVSAVKRFNYAKLYIALVFPIIINMGVYSKQRGARTTVEDVRISTLMERNVPLLSLFTQTFYKLSTLFFMSEWLKGYDQYNKFECSLPQ